MKKIIFILLLSPLLIFWGCPVGVDYPPAKPGTEKIDKRMINTWKCTKGEPEIIKMKIEKADEYSYTVTLLEKSDDLTTDQLVWTAWITKIEKKNFIFAEANGDKGKYYTYAYEMDGPVFTLMEVKFLDKGIEGITSTETFKTELINSMKKEDFISSKFYYTPSN
ncbi:MAG: hypothetical protein V2A54_03415 [Bacteroidota bacterium]